MRLTLLAALATASALLCVDAKAEVNHNCITTLEAQQVDAPPKPTSSAEKPCPVAVTFSRRARPAPGPDARDAASRRLADPRVRA
jgi:hypothetical protein